MLKAIRTLKGVEVYRDGKLIDSRKTKVPYTHAIVYMEEGSYLVSYSKSLKNAEKHNWWLQGHNYKKHIVEIENNTAEELSRMMGKLFLK